MKKKYKRAGTTSERQDYRKGGQVSKEGHERVKLLPGGMPAAMGADFSRQYAQAGVPNIDLSGLRIPEINIPVQSAQARINTGESQMTEEQKKANRDKLQQAAAGQIPTEGIIPDVQQVDANIPQQTTEMPTPTVVGQSPVTVTPAEQVTTMQPPQTAVTPTVAPVSTVQPAQIVQAPTVTAAQTTLADEELAKIAGVDRVQPIDAAEVKVKEGAVTQRVVGQLSPQSIATAAQASGTTLARVTRAKKQLRTAGLDEETITALGDNPEALEDRLTDFTEAQRGVIEGLPQEALVSNQLDTLLKGIENGEIPTWAQPAVSAVEQMLAQRGLEASTVGRDNLINAIIQSSVPIAQANAQAIQQSVAQEKTLISQEALANAQFQQQTALQNANNVFRLDLAQFTADQQTALANSKFLQTVSLQNATAEQQGIIQNAVLMSQANIVEADANTKLAIQNAKSFLSVDLANLNAEQQVNILRAQQDQQRMLTNQAAQNAAAQFNATSTNQTEQFMANLAAQMNQFNAAQQSAISEFNATQANAAAARDAGRTAEVNRLNAQLATQIEQFNANQDFARNQWNAQNAAAVEASNLQWRRQTNTANTAAQNAVNLQNAQNAFNLSTQAQAFLWQELRDQADFDFRFAENEKSRIGALLNTALAADPASYKNTKGLEALVTALADDVS
jgi:hypothetical protein